MDQISWMQIIISCLFMSGLFFGLYVILRMMRASSSGCWRGIFLKQKKQKDTNLCIQLHDSLVLDARRRLILVSTGSQTFLILLSSTGEHVMKVNDDARVCDQAFTMSQQHPTSSVGLHSCD